MEKKSKEDQQEEGRAKKSCCIGNKYELWGVEKC